MLDVLHLLFTLEFGLGGVLVTYKLVGEVEEVDELLGVVEVVLFLLEVGGLVQFAEFVVQQGGVWHLVHTVIHFVSILGHSFEVMLRTGVLETEVHVGLFQVAGFIPVSDLLGLFAGQWLHAGVHAVFVHVLLGLFEGGELDVLLYSGGLCFVQVSALFLEDDLLLLKITVEVYAYDGGDGDLGGYEGSLVDRGCLHPVPLVDSLEIRLGCGHFLFDHGQ